MKNDKIIYFHADDFGVTRKQAETILTCHSKGVLNSISVIPNTSYLSECLHMLDEQDSKYAIRRVLHLNFVEGKPVASQDSVSLLLDEEGYFSCSFVQLLKWSYSKKKEFRQMLKEQLKTEIAAQIDKVTKEFDYHISAIDSHQHYHMIPIVMEALLEVVEEKKLTIEEIRIPVDPLTPLMKTPRMWLKVPFVNWIKWGILWLHAGKIQKWLKQRGIATPVFFGIFFTCEMKKEVVEALLPQYREYADKKGKGLELMFHPGNLDESSELLDERSEELEQFYLSENRFAEAECLQQIKNASL